MKETIIVISDYLKNTEKRIELVKKGELLDLLKRDHEWEVRLEVAKRGYATNELVIDGCPAVRKEAAKKAIINGNINAVDGFISGHGNNTIKGEMEIVSVVKELSEAYFNEKYVLGKLNDIYDQLSEKSRTIVSYRYYLDKMVKDPSEKIRVNAAYKKPRKFITDESTAVREAVASKLPGLLLNDPDLNVREQAEFTLCKMTGVNLNELLEFTKRMIEQGLERGSAEIDKYSKLFEVQEKLYEEDGYRYTIEDIEKHIDDPKFKRRNPWDGEI